MPRRHALLALAVAVVWGVNFVVIDVGLDHFPPLLFAALRFTITALPAVFFVGRPGVPWRVVVAVGMLTSAGQFGLLFVAIHTGLPAGLASLVLQLQAVFTVDPRRRLPGGAARAPQLIGMACALGGIGLIAAGRAAGVPLGALLLCVAAAASWGGGNVVTRAARPPGAAGAAGVVEPRAAACRWRCCPSRSRARAMGRRVRGRRTRPGCSPSPTSSSSRPSSGSAPGRGCCRCHAASRVAPFTLLVPVIGIASAWLALDEHPNAAELIGAVVVLGGLGVTVGPQRRRRVCEAPVRCPSPLSPPLP